VRADQRAGQVHSLQRGALVDHGLRISESVIVTFGKTTARSSVESVTVAPDMTWTTSPDRVLDDRVVGNERSTVERVLHRVEVAVGGADVEPRAVEGVRVDRRRFWSHWRNHPGSSGLLPSSKVRREVGQRLRGERVTRDGDERRLRVVGLLLEVDDLVAVGSTSP